MKGKNKLSTNKPKPEKKRLIAEESREDVYNQILEGTTYRDIAANYNVKLMDLFRFLFQDPKHYELTKKCLEFSAHLLVEQAELVLRQAKDNPKLLYVAGMFAHHYRWKASMLNKRQYNNSEKNNELGGGRKEITVRLIEE